MRSLGPVIFLGATWRSARSSTALQAQTLVLSAGVDVVTVDESVADDERGYAADGVANTADCVTAAQGTGAYIGDSNRHAAAAAAAGHLSRDPTADVPELLTAISMCPKLVLPNSPAGKPPAYPPLTTTSSTATLPKITNGKRMGVARRRRRRRHLQFLQLLHFAVCMDGMLYECSCNVRRGEGRAFLDIVVIRHLADI